MGNVSLLVVEDEVIIAANLQSKLEDLGYSVLALAHSGEEALEKMAGHHPDLVLMDIQLAGEIDGIETAAHIRERFGIPVIFLTAYADEETLQRAKITEPFGYILKPFTIRELRANIEMALYKYQMERKLRESERWFATTLRCLGEAVITTDTLGTIIFMNSAAETLTGWPATEALGQNISKVFIIYEAKTQASIQNPINQILQNKTVDDLVGYSTTLVVKNGLETSIDYHTTRIIDDQGVIIGAVLIFQDITERRRAEEMLLASEKLASLGMLAAGVAHEINSPLQVITGISESLLNNLEQKTLDQDYLRRKLEVVGRNGWRCAEIVRALRTYGHASTGQREPYNLNTIVLDTLLLIEHQLSRWHNIDVVTHLAPNLPLWNCDRNQISQILINLLTNARDAMTEGGQLTISTDYTPDTGSLILQVMDTGQGIPPAVQEKIFDPFFTTKPVGQGTGLGLSIISGLVRAHSGNIKVNSVPAQGTTFTIAFHCAPAPDPQ